MKAEEFLRKNSKDGVVNVDVAMRSIHMGKKEEYDLAVSSFSKILKDNGIDDDVKGVSLVNEFVESLSE